MHDRFLDIANARAAKNAARTVALMADAIVDATARAGCATDVDMKFEGFTGAEIAEHGNAAREEAARRSTRLAA